MITRKYRALKKIHHGQPVVLGKDVDFMDRPILFSGEMVRAILEGRKTQTRRTNGLDEVNQVPEHWKYDTVLNGNMHAFTYLEGDFQGELIKCPYGQIGDRLWVRETFHKAFKKTATNNGCTYLADYGHRIDLISNEQAKHSWKWTPSIHMPRWASRITLEITNIRVERLNDISREDAKDEGVTLCPSELYPEVNTGDKLKRRFELLWESINGVGSWAANPWVWVIEFERLNK